MVGVFESMVCIIKNTEIRFHCCRSGGANYNLNTNSTACRHEEWLDHTPS